MKAEQDYVQDIAEIRSMMERSSKFLSLSGLAGVTAGIYALSGAFIVHSVLQFDPAAESDTAVLNKVILLAVGVLVLTLITAVYLSSRKAAKSGERIWNATTKRLVINMAVPLSAGGLLGLVLMAKGFIGFLAPITLLFYGLALYTAGKYTYKEMRSLGLIEIGLGLIGAWFVEYGLLLWAIGFGLLHIVYGIYMHYRYEK